MSEFLKEYCIRCDRRELPAQLHPDKNGDLTLDEIAGGRMSLVSLSPHLVDQWHPEKNGPLSPEQVLSGSNRKVWWKCSKGHEWQGKISDRVTKRSGCPYCTNRKVLAGFNDLKTVEPSMVLPGSTKRVWWRCIDGHEWKAVIYSWTGAQKCGCPVCAGKTPRSYK